MKPSTAAKVTVRLFVGLLLTSEMKMFLHQSTQWRNVSLRQKNTEEIKEVHYSGKDYIGLYLPHEKVTLEELPSVEQMIKQRLEQYCPDYDIQNARVFVFAQVFVA